MFEAACFGFKTAITGNRRLSGITAVGTRPGVELGSELSGSESWRPAGPARATQKAPFDEEV
jgi:hypothetical protein